VECRTRSKLRIRSINKNERKENGSLSAFGVSGLEASVAVKLENEGRGTPEKEGDQQKGGEIADEERAARCRLLHAKAALVDAERSLFEDLGAYVRALASRAEAEADIAIAEKERVEKMAKTLGELDLDLSKSEMERVIAENRARAREMKESNRPAKPRYYSNNGGSHPRRPPMTQPAPSRNAGKEVRVDKERFENHIKGTEALAPPSSPEVRS
jgi:hypothetical protein